MAKASPKYYSDKKKPGKAKAFFICLALAAFLWIVHSLNTVYTYNVRVPVTFRNMPRNKKPLVQMPEQLSLDIKASGLKLALILLNKPFKPVEVDFNLLKSVHRNQNYVLSSSHLDFRKILKFETQIKHIFPDTLYFSEKVGYQKNVPIKVPLYIKCREGYGYKKPVVTPSFLTIWGDTTLIDKIDTIYTQPYTLTNLDKNVNVRIDLVRPSTEVYSGINDVGVSVEVDKLVQQTITLPLSDLQNPVRQRVSIFPSTVKVTFTSIQNSFSQQDTAVFKAMIDSDKMNPATKKCPVFLSTLPGHITVMDIEPGEVEVMIFKKK